MNAATIRGLLLATCLPLPVFAAPASAGPAGNVEERPNIVFIMSDDHAWQAVSAYGRPDGTRVNHTPQIDRLAREGVRFDRFFVENAICGPSRAAFLTGCFSARHGFKTNQQRFDGTQPSWPSILQDAGYRTGVFGKWHLGTDPVGFDDYSVLIGQGPYYNPPMKTPEGRIAHRGYTTDIITEKGVAALRDFAEASREDGRPFAICIQHKAPHRRWDPHPRHFRLFEGVEVAEPATLLDDYADRSPASTLQTMTIARHLDERDLKLRPPPELDQTQRVAWDAWYEPRNEAYREAVASGELAGDDLVRAKYQRYVKDYLACVAAVDEGVGAILDEIDRLGIADDTIVVYTSDQGWYLGEHGWYDKRWMYEESFRTPFIVRWPGHLEPGRTTDLMAQNIDFAPTLIELAGGEIPARMHGESFADWLRDGAEGTPDDWRDRVYYRYYESNGPHTVPKHDGVRTDRWKLIWYPEVDPDGDGPAPAGCWELFDLEADPDELRSLADDPEHADVRRRLEASLQELRARYGE
ncbi:MAG: sulfatase [Planctomycetota bacterium]|nr:sulfatase [Planctomycetota bacterium]